tara:strand:+ start:296 stop:523 length:228 start_codon:yes stop_codon:yes gene_type:complete
MRAAGRIPIATQNAGLKSGHVGPKPGDATAAYQISASGMSLCTFRLAHATPNSDTIWAIGPVDIDWLCRNDEPAW